MGAEVQQPLVTVDIGGLDALHSAFSLRGWSYPVPLCQRGPGKPLASRTLAVLLALLFEERVASAR